MKARTIGALAMLLVISAGPVLGAEPGPGGLVFVPGPPPFQPWPAPAKAVSTDTFEEAVDRCVGDAMAAADTPGAAVAVIVGGELVYEQGYGVKRRSGAAPVDAGTQFRIGSVTKMLTAAAVMQQVEAGVVSLDDRLDHWVPEADFAGHWPAGEITVRRLLTHATGIPDLVFHPNGAVGPGAIADWAATLTSTGLHAPPGVFFNYSNPNFALAGLVVERSSGLDYRSYMTTRVFAPAGMTDTTFDPAAVTARGNWADGHHPSGAGGEIVYTPASYDNGAFAPAGYAFSTARDLARWALLLSDGGGAVLGPASAAAMQAAVQSQGSLPGYNYGLGIFVEPFYDLEIRQHGGNIWGWGTYLLWHPDRRFAVAVLANTFESLPAAAYCVADLVLEPDHGAAPSYPPPDPARLALFEGMYDASVVANLPTNPYPVEGEVFGDGPGRLAVHFWDPVGGWNAIWDLVHVGHDFFVVDVDYDGLYDLDLSFFASPDPGARPRWLRTRQLVGLPRTAPRTGRR
ncbi:MAG: beta-lactamase family protein [Thermoanaerobaculales bacterium]|jgi:CubicO group peptidase (beta-lactamase class C family)|nr:beta-lactamase family protein [Thermoanaerobaculales bacterium]